jgi:hypothetical protein
VKHDGYKLLQAQVEETVWSTSAAATAKLMGISSILQSRIVGSC